VRGRCDGRGRSSEGLNAGSAIITLERLDSNADTGEDTGTRFDLAGVPGIELLE
jgi:hypothetical protein